MSTLTAAPARFGGTKTVRAGGGPAEASLTPFLLTYAVVAVLVFLAARGSFSFLLIGAANGSVEEQNGPVKNVLVVAAFGTMLAVMLPVCRRMWHAIQQHAFLFMLPMWATVTLFWSVSPVRSLAAGLQVTILTLFGFYLAIRFSPRQLMQLFVFTGFMATLLSFATVAIIPRAGIDFKNSTIGLEGIYPQKNICAVITVELMAVAFCYDFRGTNAPLKRIGFIALLTALIIGSAARTGWILCVLTVGFIALLKFLYKLRPLERFAVTWFLPALLLGAGWLVYSNAAVLLHLIGKDITLSGRTGIWKVVFLSIVRRPWAGFGFGAFWIGENPEVRRLAAAVGDPGLSNAENGVLQLWLELGLIGVLILFALLFRTCRNAAACFRSNTPGYAIWYMSILLYNLLSLVDGNKYLLWTSIEWVMFVLADIGLANEARRLKADRTV